MITVMNSKTIVAVSLAAIFAVSMFGIHNVIASISGPNYLVVSDFSASTQGSNLVKLSATTGDDIPRKPTDFISAHAVAGIAWADLDTGKVFVATIHPTLGRDSNQNPDAWHAHTATLGAGTASSDFCVVSIDSTPTAGISIQGNTISVNVKQNTLAVPVSDIDGAVGFVIDGDSDCGSTLGVDVVVP